MSAITTMCVLPLAYDATVLMKKIFFSLFFLSGFCALLYQTVWLRLAFAQFGINAQVISLVVSVFMLGLVLGSWLAGRYIIRWAREYNINVLYFYSLAEAGVGIGALVVPTLFLFGHQWLLSFGQTSSAAYIGLSAVVLFLTLLPWCFLMGTTIPLIIEHINQPVTKDKTVFSFLYLANTFGALVGVFFTAGVFIELFGFHTTLLLAAFLNFSIAAVGVWLARRTPAISNQSTADFFTPWTIRAASAKDRFTLWLLFGTGFSLVGFEIVWNRLFTPILQTSVYAFAFIVGLYLLGTCLGLTHYRFAVRRGTVLSNRTLLIALVGLSVAQIWFVDPRIGLGIVGIILSVGSLAYVLGYLTPKQIDELSVGNPQVVGSAYALNLLGCIIGPLVASYILMPVFGSRIALLLLSLPIVILFFNKHNEASPSYQFSNGAAAFALCILVAFTAAFGTTYEEAVVVSQKVIKNDYNATVLAATLDERNPRSKYLMVNGMGITSLTPITKVMAHLPLFVVSEPKQVLDICLGMGTTFRSLTSWGIPTTAVELTPSVGAFFPYFFSDANQILARAGNRIVIDDGRRFLERTTETYDVVTIDPPPPVEAAGSSLLYSEEFYQAIKAHLTPAGVLAQWYPEKEGATLQAVAQSLVDVFPYVNAYLSIEGGGYHFLASKSPITMPDTAQIIEKMPLAAQTDLMEWNDTHEKTILDLIQKILEGKRDVRDLLPTKPNIKITDDQPYNEYFLLRRMK